jgi:multidrug efflux pump subunit AcrA (membrane-fusion protein)
MKKIFLIIPLILLMAGGVILLKKRKHSIAAAPTATPMTYAVRTVQAKTGTVAQADSFLARLESVNSAEISSKLSGRISEVLIRESQQVTAGELLIKIDDQEIQAGIKGLQAQLSSARAQMEFARSQYGRDQALFKAGGLAKDKLDASRVADQSARAAVLDLEQKIKGMESQLEYLQVKAPFAGTVGTIMLRQGDLAVPGRPLLTLNSRQQKLTFSFMPGSSRIEIGQEVFRKGDTARIGTVVNLYSDAKNGLTVAEVEPDTPLNMPNNSFLSIIVVEKNVKGCTVPARALLHRADSTSVMVYQDGQFNEHLVTVKARDTQDSVIDPCPDGPVAVAAEAKLSLLPGLGTVKIISGAGNE